MRALLLLLLAPLANAQIYSSVDANGQRVFTDRPTEHAAAPVKLNPTNHIASDPTLLPLRVLKPEPEPEAQVSYTLEILSPENDQTIRDGSGTLVVEVASEPPLEPNHFFQVMLDQTIAGEPTQSSSITLAQVDRGTHTLRVAVVNARGQQQALSNAKTVHIKRTSLSDRKRTNPCTLDDYGRRLECPLKDKPEPKKDIPFIPFI